MTPRRREDTSIGKDLHMPKAENRPSARRGILWQILVLVVQMAIILTFGLLCVVELIPPPAYELIYSEIGIGDSFPVILLMLLSGLAVLLALFHFAGLPPGIVNLTKQFSAIWFIALLNIIPIIAWIVTTLVFLLKDDCADSSFVESNGDCKDGWSLKFDNESNFWSILLDTVGLVTARLARLDFGLCMMLSAAAKWPWLLGATSGWLGYPEGMPVHRLVGWYCLGQSVIHSIAYFVFYFVLYGWIGIWQTCFPVLRTNATRIHRMETNSSDVEKLNTLGLVNFFGVVAFALSLLLLIPALPWIRKNYYNSFQCLHLPSALLFVLFGALHDLPWINFGIPALAEWFLGQLGTSMGYTGRQCSCPLHAKASVLPGTSGPWVALTVELGASRKPSGNLSSRGQWASVRVIALGREFHPLSVAMSNTSNGPQLSAWITAKAGDWSKRVAHLASKRSSFDVEIKGPFPDGGGNWSLNAGDGTRDALLLIAGGTGITGWLPGLAHIGHGRRCHLVWCVQAEADYLALAHLLPAPACGDSLEVTVYVTRSNTVADIPLCNQTGTPDTNWIIEDKNRCKRSLLMLVSLCAAVMGLVMSQWGWREGLYRWLTRPTTFLGYTVIFRSLPIVMIVAAIVLGSLIGNGIYVWANRQTRTPMCSQTDEDTFSNPEQPFLETTNFSADDNISDENPQSNHHNLKSGRPDINALVQSAARQTGRWGRLVVAVSRTPGRSVSRRISGPPPATKASSAAAAMI